MSDFTKRETCLPGLLLIEPTVLTDHRGFFTEYYSEEAFLGLGIKRRFVQDNHSKSKKGVLRGLHFQRRRPQGKLVKVLSGATFDVAVDLRAGSPFYGQWYGVLLTEENPKMLYLPEGFAHGFLVLSESADLIYKCTDFYNPEDEGGVRWDDPDIGIQWPFSEYGIEAPILSQKDRNQKRLRELENLFLFKELP